MPFHCAATSLQTMTTVTMANKSVEKNQLSSVKNAFFRSRNLAQDVNTRKFKEVEKSEL